MQEATVQALHAAITLYKVLFFRGQHALGDAEQEVLAARFGEPVAHPTLHIAEGSRFLLELESMDGHAPSSWHTDLTFLVAHPQTYILRAVTIPPLGGDTLWANTAAAYADLPPPLQALAHELKAIHTNVYDYVAVTDRVERHRHIPFPAVYEAEHPVVRVLPESNERALLLGHFVKQFVGLTTWDTQRLLTVFQDHITKPENTVRWRWQAGDVVIWDGRTTQHRAIADFGLQHRVLRRAAVQDSVPIAIDGSVSRAIMPIEPRESAAASM
jgi:taurine dioxygenase